MKIKSLFTTVICLPIILCFYGNLSAQDRKVHIRFEDIKVDSIEYRFAVSSEEYAAKGATKDGINWEFVIPEEIFLTYRSNNLYIYRDGRRKSVYFMNPNGNGFNAILFDDRTESRMALRHIEETENNMRLLITGESDPDIPLSIDFWRENFRWTVTNEYSLTPEQQIDSMITRIKKYPDSFALIKLLKLEMRRRNSNIEDVIKMYNSFSERMQQSVPGQDIFNYIMQKQASIGFSDTTRRSDVTAGMTEFGMTEHLGWGIEGYEALSKTTDLNPPGNTLP